MVRHGLTNAHNGSIPKPTLHPKMTVLFDARNDFPPAVTVRERRLEWALFTKAIARPVVLEMTARDTRVLGETSIPSHDASRTR